MPRTWFDADAVEQVVDVAFRFARDSSLEEAVYCELVSEMKFPEF